MKIENGDSRKRCLILGCHTEYSIAPEMDPIVLIVYGLKPLTIFIENSLLDAMVVLDLLSVTFSLLTTLNKIIFSRLLKCKTISLESGQR